MNRRQLHYAILLNRTQLYYVILVCRLEVVQFRHILLYLAIYFSFAQKNYILLFGACGTKRDEFVVNERTFGHSQTRGQASCQSVSCKHVRRE